MNRIYAFLLIILIISPGCGGKEKVKPSADSETAQNALLAVDTVKNAYLNKEEGVLLENLEPGLSDEILKGLSFEEAELSFNPRLIRITASSVMVQLNWQGQWVVGNKTLRNRGSGTLVLNRETMKLKQVDGDSPFVIPLSGE
jgi:hypothetical protein